MMEQGLIGDNFSAIALSCAGCNACIPLRIKTKAYTATKTLQTAQRRNQDLIDNLSFTQAEFDMRLKGPELYTLFKKYMANRHPYSLMGEYDYHNFQAFAMPQSHLLTLRTTQGKILAAALLDIEDSPSVVRSMHFYYAFYDTDAAHKNRSLGTALWLAGIKHAQSRQIENIYVGAGAEGSPKLAYKFSYPGLEAFTNGKWEAYDPAKHTRGPDFSDWLQENTQPLPGNL